ncbi:MAG: chromosome condensation regulator RCC1 [Legionella sp.]|uniref:RCC1 domain-containing protein n=1 Tax=Legionella sp. TaxID=459 RepID=UPI0039E5E93F
MDNMYGKEENFYSALRLYIIFDNMPLDSIIKLSCVNTQLNEIITAYLKTELQIKQIACGQTHTLVLLKKGRVFATGENKHGQLGLSDDKYFVFSEITDIERMEAISAGFDHSVMLSKEKNVWVMGNNDNNQLTFQETVSKQNTNPLEAFSLEENKIKLVPLQRSISLTQVKAISAVDHTTVVLNEDGTIKVCGNPQLQACIINQQLKLLPAWLINELPKDLNIVDVSFGQCHALCLTKEGEVYCFGSNDQGLLGLGKEIEQCASWTKLCNCKASKIKATALGSFILTTDQRLLVSGINSQQQLGTLEKSIFTFAEIATEVKDFDANDWHTVYLDKNNQLYSMGCNESGQLGIGRSTKQDEITQKSLISVKHRIASVLPIEEKFPFISQLSRKIKMKEPEWEDNEEFERDDYWGEESEMSLGS